MSNLKVFGSPEKYVQGPNATSHIGSEMQKLGMKGPVVLVTTGTPKRLLGPAWTKSLQEAGYEFKELDFGGLCTAAEARRIADFARGEGAKTMIAFGGGQVIDVVRAASIDASCEVVSCPTVASTDAPCSTLCVMYHADHSFQEYLLTKRHPTLVLVDTAAIAKSPRRMLVGGLGDALATWFEARSVREAGSDNFLGAKQTATGLALAKLSYDILIEDGAAGVRSVDANAVTPALERVVEANTLLSGLGFESGGLCIAHAVHNGLTTQPKCADYTHGEKVAFGLLTQLVAEGRPQSEVQTVLEFCTSVGLPVTLAAVGVDANDDDAVMEIAERATVKGETSHNGPVDVTAEVVAHAIRAADRCGALYLQGKAT